MSINHLQAIDSSTYGNHLTLVLPPEARPASITKVSGPMPEHIHAVHADACPDFFVIEDASFPLRDHALLAEWCGEQCDHDDPCVSAHCAGLTLMLGPAK